jgi:DNA-directed RNA polymerase specialized sigma24 family protein
MTSGPLSAWRAELPAEPPREQRLLVAGLLEAAIPVVFRAALQLTPDGSAAAAEALVLDAMRRAATSWESDRGEMSVTAWCLRALVRAARMHGEVSLAPALEAAAPPGGAPDQRQGTVADELPGHWGRVGRTPAALSTREVSSALRALPHDQRLVLTVVLAGDMNVTDAAVALEWPVDVVRAQLRAGRRALGAALRRSLDSRPPE